MDDNKTDDDFDLNEEEDDLLALMLHQSKKKTFRRRLSLRQKRMRSGNIRRGALLTPDKSPFAYLFHSGQDDALVTLCGFDYTSFERIHVLFKPFYETTVFCEETGMIRKIKHPGRPRTFTSWMLLGLVLAWTRTRGSMKVLQLIFGFTSSPLSRWLP